MQSWLHNAWREAAFRAECTICWIDLIWCSVDPTPHRCSQCRLTFTLPCGVCVRPIPQRGGDGTQRTLEGAKRENTKIAPVAARYVNLPLGPLDAKRLNKSTCAGAWNYFGAPIPPSVLAHKNSFLRKLFCPKIKRCVRSAQNKLTFVAQRTKVKSSYANCDSRSNSSSSLSGSAVCGGPTCLRSWSMIAVESRVTVVHVECKYDEWKLKNEKIFYVPIRLHESTRRGIWRWTR